MKQIISSKFQKYVFRNRLLDIRKLQRFGFFIGHPTIITQHMMRKPYLYFFVASNLFFLNKSLSQTLLTDTVFYKSAVSNIIQSYMDSLKGQLRLYNGTEFTGGYRSSLGSPFFEYPEAQKGDVFYDGILYPSVLLQYDLVRDEVIFTDPVKNLNIKLISEKISWFTIRGHLFIHLHEENNDVNFPGSGFYEILHEEPVSFLVKRRKKLFESSKADEVSKFIQSNEYYIKRDTVYFSVDSKRSLSAPFKDVRSEISKFMQKQNLNFKKDPEKVTVKVIDYYIQLKK